MKEHVQGHPTENDVGHTVDWIFRMIELLLPLSYHSDVAFSDLSYLISGYAALEGDSSSLDKALPDSKDLEGKMRTEELDREAQDKG
jgi:hypothetical protein